MGVFLKILLSGLLLLLLLAVGAEVVALHRSSLPDPTRAIPAVVVRKATQANTPLKTVRLVPGMAAEKTVRGCKGALVLPDNGVVRH